MRLPPNLPTPLDPRDAARVARAAVKARRSTVMDIDALVDKIVDDPIFKRQMDAMFAAPRAVVDTVAERRVAVDDLRKAKKTLDRAVDAACNRYNTSTVAGQIALDPLLEAAGEASDGLNEATDEILNAPPRCWPPVVAVAVVAADLRKAAEAYRAVANAPR
jgi:hypothetical protein